MLKCDDYEYRKYFLKGTNYYGIIKIGKYNDGTFLLIGIKESRWFDDIESIENVLKKIFPEKKYKKPEISDNFIETFI